MHPHSSPRCRHNSQGAPSRMKSPVGQISRKLWMVITTGIRAFLHSLRAGGDMKGYRLCTFTTSGCSRSMASRMAFIPEGHQSPDRKPLILPEIDSRAPAVDMRSCATSWPRPVKIMAILSTTASSPLYLPYSL